MGRKRKFPKNKQTKSKWFQKEDAWGNFVFDWSLGLENETWRGIFALLIMLSSLFIVLGFFGWAGDFGSYFSGLIKQFFGTFASYFFVLMVFYIGKTLFAPKDNDLTIGRLLGFIIFIVFFSSLVQLFYSEEISSEVARYGHGGGFIGHLVSFPLRNSIGLFSAFLLSVCFSVIGVFMSLNFSVTKYLGIGKSNEDEEKKVKINHSNKISVFESAFRKVNLFRKKEASESKAPVVEVDVPIERIIKPDLTWEYPSIEVLKSTDEAPNPGNINKNVEIIKKCLDTFGINIDMADVNVGPTVTQYCFKPTEGVKLNQIVARQTDLALALSAKSLRMEAPIVGKNLVGIEIPNVISAKVTLKEVLREKEFRAVKSKLAFALGRDVSGEPLAIDLEKMPHLLIAGSTGSGKSVCINSTICSFLFNNSPRDLRLLLVDPKRVELTNYNGIPHLLSPVITEVEKTVSALKWAVWEMERRYKIFSELGKRNITAYNAAPGPEGRLPYIVIVIDELADLMATSAKEVEGSVVRLAQMARATGMHLVIATQRPSVDVLTGLIKANITSRIAFATASQVDSRTILDLSGAEKLLGNGDMLFIGNGINKPKRVQGCFVSDHEIDELIKYLQNKEEPVYDGAILSFRSGSGRASGGNMSGDGVEEDDLYNEALETVINAGKASASLLQRRLRVGYARAARLLDILERQGAIGPADGAKPRDVLITDPGMVNILSQNNQGANIFDTNKTSDYDDYEQ